MKQMETGKNDGGMSWEMVKLSSVAEVIAGQSPESKYYNDKGDGIPFFQGKADFRIDYPIVRYWCTQPTKIAMPMDILMSVRAPVGPTNICDVKACIGRGLAAIRTNDKLHYKYLYFYFKSIEEKIASQGNGSTFSAITTSVLKDLQIPLPPLPIQKRIAEILDAADALKRKDQELLKKYDELAQAIFIDMFGDPVKNEKGWEVKKLKEISIKITDGTHYSPPNQPSGIPYITAKHLKQDLIDFYCNPTYISQKDHEEIFSRCTPVRGDILYIKDGATTGIAAVNEYDFEFSMLSSLALIKPRKDSLNSYFLSCYLNNENVKKELIRSYMAGAAIKRFTLDKINKFDIMLPPIELQNSFETRWKKIRQSILAVKNSKSNNLFQTLIQKAFKGELVA